MKASLVGVSAVCLVGAVIALTTYVVPFVRSAKLDEHYEEMRYQAARLGLRNAIVEKPDEWVESLSKSGVRPIIDISRESTAEVYRVTFGRSLKGKTGMITVVLGQKPTIEVAESDGKEMKVRATRILDSNSEDRIRHAVVRSRLWSVDFYATPTGCDGEMWYFEGAAAGRYRRLEEWCPQPGLVRYACEAIASCARSDLADQVD